jgi:hypothetical protein
MNENAFCKEKEYYALFDVINKYDERYITVKGWGATVSMAALGAGFQYGHYGIFLVACISGVVFCAIEAIMKRHQMRYYVRMRQIEAERIGEEYRPQIDWGWTQAPQYYKGVLGATEELPATKNYGKRFWYRLPIFPSVIFPYIISILAGAILFIFGYVGWLKLADGNTMPM